jgi:D-beta-D-heptose 7-phosphate kinase/D-beta-D-heptose 1-phosphate adenosyltransferase
VAQHQQVVRFDREKTGELSSARLAETKRFLDEHLHDFDAVIVSDYDKGMISQALMTRLRKILATSNIPLIVDPKPRNPERFKGATIITPNHHEAELLAGMKIGNEKELTAAIKKLQKTLDCQAVLITRGEAGMALYEKGKPLYTIPTVAKEVYDVTGAGDTVAATLALGLAVGLGFAEAATLANFAAGIVVGKVGTATASTEELLRAIA